MSFRMSGSMIAFQRWLFTLSEVAYRQYMSGAGREKQFASAHTLLTVTQGEGVLRYDDRRLRLARGVVVRIEPNTQYDLECAGDAALVVCSVCFCAAPIQDGDGEERPRADGAASSPLRLPTYLDVRPFSHWMEMLEQLHEGRSESEREGESESRLRGKDDALAAFRRHIRLQQLLYYVCERNDHTVDCSRYAVLRTIDELHAHMARPVGIQQLAGWANMGVRHYSYVFKDITGLSPIDYITELRMDYARKQLLLSGGTVSAVAREAGFRDVYYFSRRFKQLTGVSPTDYVRRGRKQLRIVALYYSGILLAMGTKPVGANLSLWGGSAFLQELESGVLNIGNAPSLEVLAGLEPDLILMNDLHAGHYERYSRIAPTVMIPYDGRRSVYDDVRLVSELIGSTPEAEQFIARYERKAAVYREQIARAGIGNEATTAAIIRIEQGGSHFTVFGDNYGRSGWGVYRGFRFCAPRRVRQLIDSGQQIELRLPIDRLSEYAGSADYLFVVNEGESMSQVAATGCWKRLPAVEGQRVFELDYRRFTYLDPISLERQLDLLTELLLDQKKGDSPR